MPPFATWQVRTLFQEVDKSNDGLISHEELESYIAADLQPGAVAFETGPARNRCSYWRTLRQRYH